MIKLGTENIMGHIFIQRDSGYEFNVKGYNPNFHGNGYTVILQSTTAPQAFTITIPMDHLQDQINTQGGIWRLKGTPDECLHENFHVGANVIRLVDDDDRNKVVGFHADLKISCTECKQVFEFIGIEPGFSFFRPMTDLTFTALRLPIKPPTPRPVDKSNLN